MDQNKFDHLRQSAKISIGLLVVLFILSIVLYKLRMYFLDAPFVVFQIIKEDSLAIMVGRYGALITQVFPWMGQKMGLPMSTILLLYSMSFNLFYLVSGLFLYKIKAYHWVILLAFYQIGFATDAFFWTNNEIHQGVAYLALSVGFWYYANTKQTEKRLITYSVSAILLLIAVLTHPLVIPIIIFIAGFMFITKELSVKNKGDIMLVLYVVAVCVLKYFLSKSNWYDGDKLNQLSNYDVSAWLSFMEKPAAKTFLPELLYHHWSALLVIIALVFILIQQKKIKILIYVVSFALLYMLAITMIVHEYTRFYTESQWMAVAIFIAIPLVYYSSKYKHFMISGFTVFVISLWFLNMIAPYERFSQRYNWQKSKLEKMNVLGMDKLLLSDAKIEVTDTLMMTWGLPVESLIMSVAEYKKPMTMLINQVERSKNDPKVFLSCFEEVSISKLNHRYFPLDSNSMYKIESYESFDKK